MKHVRFDGPVGHRLHAFGQEISGGETVEMPDEQAAQLAADPHVPVTVTAVASPRPQAARGASQTKHEEEE